MTFVGDGECTVLGMQAHLLQIVVAAVAAAISRVTVGGQPCRLLLRHGACPVAALLRALGGWPQRVLHANTKVLMSVASLQGRQHKAIRQELHCR